jgi:hypothetical protein
MQRHNAAGELVSLGDSMGTGSSLVIFPRHQDLFCLSYAKKVCELQPPEGVKGPFFVSIGDAENSMLWSLNPYIPVEKCVRDGIPWTPMTRRL